MPARPAVARPEGLARRSSRIGEGPMRQALPAAPSVRRGGGRDLRVALHHRHVIGRERLRRQPREEGGGPRLSSDGLVSARSPAAGVISRSSVSARPRPPKACETAWTKSPRRRTTCRRSSSGCARRAGGPAQAPAAKPPARSRRRRVDGGHGLGSGRKGGVRLVKASPAVQPDRNGPTRPARDRTGGQSQVI